MKKILRYDIIQMKEKGIEMNVLVLDDEKEIADLVELYLKNEDYTIYKCYTSEEAIKYIDTVKLDIGVRIDIWTHFMRECIMNYVH